MWLILQEFFGLWVKASAQHRRFAGPQTRLLVFWKRAHFVINPAKQVGDPVYSGHDRSPLAINFVSLYRLTWRRSWLLQLSLKN
jgi:hypothetical protein